MKVLKRPGVRSKKTKRSQTGQPVKVVEKTRVVVVDRHTREVQNRDTGFGLGSVLAAGLVGHMIGSSKTKAHEANEVPQRVMDEPEDFLEPQTEEPEVNEPEPEPEPEPAYESSESFSSSDDSGGGYTD